MKPKTDTEKNARCAELMGYNLDCSHDIYYMTEKGKIVYHKADYSPITKIEQALEFAGVMRKTKGYRTEISPTGDGLFFVRIYHFPKDNAENLVRFTGTLLDCARKIVETVLEVKNG